ncbi:hypothetical protein SEA_FINNRY_137 [Mycobacterium phage Finnry]|nr:hypothetical protein SEA_FINNRY_137 [Mycobacterium phage Finnry]
MCGLGVLSGIARALLGANACRAAGAAWLRSWRAALTALSDCP